jgi:hypothetical protein
LNQSDSGVDTTHEALSMISNGQTDQYTNTGVDGRTGATVLSAVQPDSKIREEALISLEFMYTDIVQGMASQAQRGDSKHDGTQTNEANPTGHVGEIPQYMETLVAGPAALEDRPLTAAADRLSRLMTRKGQLRNRISKTQADYTILQEDSRRRMAVGVALDIYSQRYLDDYPHTCNSLQKELAAIEAEIVVCQKAVKRGGEQIPLVSRIFFHMDQFAGCSTNYRPTELDIEDGEDLEAQWGTFEDLWPVPSNIPYPKHLNNWMSMTLEIMRTHKEFLHAYVSFWFFKCVQASWLSFSRFVYYHYLDNISAPNYKFIKIRVLQSWFDKALSTGLHKSQNGPTGYFGASPLLTNDSEVDEKTRENQTKSRWSVGAQVDVTLPPRRPTSPKGLGSFRKFAQSLPRAIRNGPWRWSDPNATSL